MSKERLTDKIDRAAELTAQFTRAALEAHLARPNLSVGEQRVVDGAAVCVECDEAIPPARLRALPGCIRCVTCQEEIDAEKVQNVNTERSNEMGYRE